MLVITRSLKMESEKKMMIMRPAAFYWISCRPEEAEPILAD